MIGLSLSVSIVDTILACHRHATIAIAIAIAIAALTHIRAVNKKLS